ncbi:MAG: arginase family protein [Bacteriovoracia bacterium]
MKIAAKKIKQTCFDSIKDWEKSSSKQSKGICLLKASDDRGILNVGGRLGARLAPSVVVNAFSEMILGMDPKLREIDFIVGSDVNLGKSIEFAHDSLVSNISTAYEKKLFPVVIGGGHDFGYPHVSAVTQRFGVKNVALINVDAHLDVRPVAGGVITSGSPFYLALENKKIIPNNFVEFGIQSHCNDIELANYLRKKKVKVVSLKEARKKNLVKAFEQILARFSKKKVVVSIDLDAVAMAFCPGVSAPQADGLTSQELLEICEISGKSKVVVSVGFFELSPILDENNKSIRLAATAIHRLASAFANRK